MRALIEHPTMRSAPAPLMERLREIDPSAELVYVGRGHWALGSVRPHREREQRARAALGHQHRLSEELRSVGAILFARIRLQGFRQIALYSEDEVESGALLLDFRERDWNWRHRADAAYRERVRAADYEAGGSIERRIETMLDYLHGEGPSIYNYAIRGRRSVGPSQN